MVSESMFNLEKARFAGFYRKSLDNMIKFWMKLEREKIINKNLENIDPNI